jgi:stress-induced morphogen
MPLPASTLESLLRAAFPDAHITLNDLAGDNDHWEVIVICESFRGQPRIEQHRRVQAALKDVLGGPLHAVKILTKAP